MTRCAGTHAKAGEDEAYRRIQQQSMNARKSMKEVAEAIIIAQGV